jgi:flagellin-like protein
MYEKFKSRVLKRMGVSPVIATLLLILIAVAAAVLVYFWVSGYIGTATRARPEMEERIKIEAVSANTTGATCYVRNIGDIDATIKAAYIESKGRIVASSINVDSSVPVGDVAAIALNGNLSLIPNEIYTIKVVTRTGLEASYVFKVVS